MVKVPVSLRKYYPGQGLIIKAMRITVILTLACVVNLYANGYSQEKLTLSLKEVKLSQVFEVIQQQTNYQFLYNDEDLQNAPPVSVTASESTVPQILAACFTKNYPLEYRIEDSTVVVLKKSGLPQNVQIPEKTAMDQFTIEGKVTDPSGNPLAGVTVSLKGAPTGTITDANGHYSLTLEREDGTLVFSYVGFEKKAVAVNGRAVINITLSETTTGLNQLVVVGYGVEKKGDLTGAVSAIDFDKVPVASRPLTNVSSALEGMASGMFVDQQAGAPSDNGATIVIRGTGSLNASQAPLVVIDGHPGNIDAVNPNDVASISVLKDAASAAIYGSRASNGVILITTKSGGNTNGKVTFNYTGYVGFSKPTKLYTLVANTPKHMQIVNEIAKNSAIPEPYTEQWINEWKTKSKTDPRLFPNTNWWDAIIKPNTIQKHNLSASGGSEHIRFYSSLGILDNNGLMDNTAYRQINFRSNLTYTVNKWIQLGSIVTGLFGKADPATVDEVFQWWRATTPGMLPKSADGRYGGGMTGGQETLANNPLMTLENQLGEKNTQRYSGKLSVTLTPAKGLQINSNYYISRYNYDDWSSSRPQDLWNFQDSTIVRHAGTTLQIANAFAKEKTNIFNLYATYQRTIAENNLKLMLGYNQEYFKHQQFGASKNNLISLDIPVLDAATDVVSATGDNFDYALRSYFGRLNYNYADKYLFEANLRIDGSSRFSPENRWGVFPSFSAGWRLSAEPFWRALSGLFDHFKIRGSWGRLGNNGIGNYAWQSVYSAANTSFNNNTVQGLAPAAISNENITWETTDITDIGIDFGLLQKLSFTFDYYHKFTHGILANIPIPLVNGGLTPPLQNSAQVRNTGFEGDVAYSVDIGKLSLRVSANGSYNNNRIVRYKGDLLEPHGPGVWTEGKPIGIFWVRKVDHIVQSQSDIDKKVGAGWVFQPSTPGPGDFLYRDIDRNDTIDNRDRVLEGNPIPLFTYGGTISLTYGGFDFYALFNGVAGWDKYLGPAYNSGNNPNIFTLEPHIDGYLYPAFYLDAWTEQNKSTTVPKLYNANDKNNLQSDYFVHSSAYFRLKSIQLGYTIPAHITEKIKINKVRAFVNLENYFLFTSYPGMDPETAGSTYDNSVTYPLMKTISFGLNIQF